MDVSSRQHGDAVQAFLKWKDSPEAKLSGIGGPLFEAEFTFIPQSNLKKYFEESLRWANLLDDVLDNKQRQAVNANYLRHNYARSFAILLSIGQGSLIHHFQQHDSLRDQKLPHDARPADFPKMSPDRFEEFKNAQWQFCALKLEDGMSSHLKEENIVPIIRRETIGKGGSAIVYKIVVEEEYNLLRLRNVSPSVRSYCPCIDLRIC